MSSPIGGLRRGESRFSSGRDRAGQASGQKDDSANSVAGLADLLVGR